MSEHIDTRPLYRRTLGKSFWFSVNTLRRTWSGAKKAPLRLYAQARSTTHETRRTVRRALGKSFWYAVKQVQRTKKEAKRLRRRVYSRARYTSHGRAMLAVSELVTSPRDAFRRRRVVAAFNRRLPNTQLDRRDGYVILPSGALPGTNEILPICLRLFNEKRPRIDGLTAPDATADRPKKFAFMKSVLTNEDLVKNPELVDFALSDGLLSLVTNYLGTIPHLNRIDLLYSVSRGEEDVVSSQMYHLDPEGMWQAKLFLNLRDVGPDEGPFTFIPAADSKRIMQAIKARGREDGELAMARYLDREIAEVGGLDKAISVMGTTGSAAIVDTSRCLHCGSRVKPGTYRLCLYIQYCTSREHGNLFDVQRHRADPVRFLATVNSQRSAHGAVAAPHQMN
jgi:hypothetical protein